MLRTSFRLACAGTLLTLAIGATATAQVADKRTFFTFSGPVALPGTDLPAGKYLFRLADENSGRRIVQVMTADGKKPIGLFFSIPAQRADLASDPEVRFIETPRGTPGAIKTWWYPGERTGYEFIYPKAQARRLAQSARQPVLTTQAQTTTAEETNTADLTRVSGAGEEAKVAENTPAAPVTGVSQRGEVATDDAMARSTATNTMARRSTRAELPRTATSMPTVALAGTLMLLAGASLWLSRRRQQL